MNGLVDYGIIKPELAGSFGAGYRAVDQERQAEQLNNLRIQSARTEQELAGFNLDKIKQDRLELQKLQSKLQEHGVNIQPRQYIEALIGTGIPNYVEQGLKARADLDELERYQREFGGGTAAAPAAAAPAAVPAGNELRMGMTPATTDTETGVTVQPTTAPTVARQSVDAPMNGLMPTPAAPTNALTDPAARLAKLQADYERLSGFKNVPQATARAKLAADEIKQLQTYHTVGNTLTQGGVPVYTAAPMAAPAIQQRENGKEKWSVKIDPNTGEETEIAGSRHKMELTPYQEKELQLQRERLDKLNVSLPPEQSALISRAILEGRLDPNKVNSKNAPIIGSTLLANPEADLRGLALTATTESASARTLGNISANVVTASNEAEKMIPIVEKYVTAIKPTDYPILNEAGLFVAKNTGDRNQAGLATSLNALVNTYARAINPRGTPTVSDKNHAREVINRAMSTGQFSEVLSVMRQEMAASQAAPREARGKLFSGAQPSAQSKPKVGTVDGGYKFLGGDPADPKSWEKQ